MGFQKGTCKTKGTTGKILSEAPVCRKSVPGVGGRGCARLDEALHRTSDAKERHLWPHLGRWEQGRSLVVEGRPHKRNHSSRRRKKQDLGEGKLVWDVGEGSLDGQSRHEGTRSR